MHKLSDTINRKFIEDIELSGWEIETDTGFQHVSNLKKTIPYQRWVIRTYDDHLECADDHIVFDENLNEVFVKDLIIGSKIQTKSGIKEIVSIEKTVIFENMFDMSINDDNHRFYTNNILSHNSTTAAAYIVWYLIFNANKTAAILANKESTAKEILERAKLMYSLLPKWLQQGVVVWNKKSIELENGSKVFASSTSSSAIRGFSVSCVIGSTKITVCDEFENVYHTPIDNLLNKGKLIEDKMFYIVYKITNKINGKIYVGYHQTKNIDDGYMGSGKLIKKAIEKYGIENFEKDIIEVFDNKIDAERLESKIVDKDFTLREDTYNISIGGNVRIFHGKNNGFYGKKHSKETRMRISAGGKGKIKISPKHEIISGSKSFHSLDSFKEYKKISREKCLELIGNPAIEDTYYVDAEKQALAERMFFKNQEDRVAGKERLAIAARERFAGKPIKESTKKKISESLKGHKKSEEWINKINKNPEKIKKTAEKHRGMKRTDESKQRMSSKRKSFINSLTKKERAVVTGKGCIYINCKESGKIKRWNKNTEIPDGWERGTKCKS